MPLFVYKSKLIKIGSVFYRTRLSNLSSHPNVQNCIKNFLPGRLTSGRPQQRAEDWAASDRRRGQDWWEAGRTAPHPSPPRSPGPQRHSAHQSEPLRMADRDGVGCYAQWPPARIHLEYANPWCTVRIHLEYANPWNTVSIHLEYANPWSTVGWSDLYTFFEFWNYT